MIEQCGNPYVARVIAHSIRKAIVYSEMKVGPCIGKGGSGALLANTPVALKAPSCGRARFLGRCTLVHPRTPQVGSFAGTCIFGRSHTIGPVRASVPYLDTTYSFVVRHRQHWSPA